MKKTLASIAAAAALSMAVSANAGATERSGGTVEVPVLAQMAVQSPGEPQAIITIHGVRRLKHSAVIYFSIGYPKGTGDDFFDVLGHHYTAFGGDVSDPLGNAAAIDNKTGTAYAALSSGSNSSCFCTQQGLDSPAAGKAYVGYTEVAAIPESVTAVSVFLGQQVFPAVPVQNGPLMPQLPTTQLNRSTGNSTIVVGTGWPTPATKNNPALGDPVGIPSAAEQHKNFIYDITTRVVQGALTQSGNTIDLSGDVLFDFAKYNLTAKGKQAVTAAVAKLKAAHVTAVSVTGYTDNTGDDSINLPLSRNRAKTVATELKRLMPSLKITQSGKGDADPVATNDTSTGRQANRRVEIVPTSGGHS